MNKEQLTQWRERLDLTQRQMTRYVGVSEATWRSWESGRRRVQGPALRLLGVLTMLESVCPAVHDSLISGVKS